MSCQLPDLHYVRRRLTKREPDPRSNAGVMMVGVAAFSGGLRGLKLVPAKLYYFVLPRRIDWRSRVEITCGYPHPHQGAVQGATQTQTVRLQDRIGAHHEIRRICRLVALGNSIAHLCRSYECALADQFAQAGFVGVVSYVLEF